MSETGADEVLVHTCQGELEMQLARDLLNRHAIPNRYQGEALRLTHGFTADGLAMVRIYVPTEHAERARELLAALADGELALEEGDGPNEGTPRKDWKNLP
jgi:hypothetical protein